MEYSLVYQSLLLISLFFIVSTLATSSPPGPSPTLQPVSSPNAAPESSPTSSPLPSSIHIGVTPSPHVGSPEAPSSVESDAPESFATVPTSSPGPSPILMPVSSPNAEPELSPTSSSLPPPPSTDFEESPEGPDGELSVSGQSDEPEPETDAAESETETETQPDSETEPEPEPDSEPMQESDNADVEVDKVCESTDYPSLCMNTIDPLVKTKNEVSLDKVLEASIKAANDLAKVAKETATKLANNPGTRPELASVLKVCQESYDDALDNFQKAKEACDTLDVGTMKTMLSAVITDISDCNDEFSLLSIPSPIDKFAEKLSNMTSNSLAIVSLLQN